MISKFWQSIQRRIIGYCRMLYLFKKTFHYIYAIALAAKTYKIEVSDSVSANSKTSHIRIKRCL